MSEFHKNTKELADATNNGDFFELFEAIRCHSSVRKKLYDCANMMNTSQSTLSRDISKKKYKLFTAENLSLLVDVFKNTRAQQLIAATSEPHKLLDDAEKKCFDSAIKKLWALRGFTVEEEVLERLENPLKATKDCSFVEKYYFSGSLLNHTKRTGTQSR